MKEIESESVPLVVTSPPYNCGRVYDRYDDRLPWPRYLDLLYAVWQECARVLIPGGRLAINVANVGRQPYIPLHAFVIQQLLDLGFLLRGEIIWDKRGSAGSSTAWGSYASATNPVLRDVHEYIIVASKGTYALDGPGDTDIAPADFVEWSKSVWRFNAARAPSHPCVFPIELPRRLILFYSRVGDVVLDPFMGSGTTALAAQQTGRRWIGYELSAKYIKQAFVRLRAMKGEACSSKYPAASRSTSTRTRRPT